MQFPFPFLDELIIPLDAGVGDARVVISSDSNGGFVEVYDAAGVLVGRWDAVDFRVLAASQNGSRIVISPANTPTGSSAVFIRPRNRADAETLIDGSIQGFLEFGASIEAPAIAIIGSSLASETAPASGRIELIGQDTPNGIPVIINIAPRAANGYVDFPLDSGKTIDVKIGGVSIGRGAITGFGFRDTTNDGPYSGDSNTDFAINNIPAIAGRTIEFSFNSRYSLDAAGEWALELMVNGTKVDEVGYIRDASAGSGRVSGIGQWTPSTTQATDDIVVFANELSGTSQLTFVGSANTPRYLTPKDIGIV